MTPVLTAKQASAVIPTLAAALALNTDAVVMVAAVSGGLLFGGLWRAGSLASEGKAWVAIRRDAGISVLVAGANVVLTLAIIRVFDLGVLLGMAVAVVVGATGVRALPEIKAAFLGWARRKIIGDDIALVNPRNPDLDAKLRELGRPPRDPPL